MANNKVNFLRGTSAEYEASTKDNDTFYYTTDTKKLYLGENEVGNGIDPKVIQAHIDNQTIHAKVWRGTQEEYNAIEPKEDDTVYIIKDSDNTLADKLIDDTSTTATDKTWSAKKINENDEVARAAINTHAGNDEIHVTAAEKSNWVKWIPRDMDIINDPTYESPYESYINDTDAVNLGIVSQNNGSYWHILYLRALPGMGYGLQIAMPLNKEAGMPCYRKSEGTVWDNWRRFADGGNADTLDGLHANEIASNPNLLINPDFRINQRGISSPTAAFGADRWAGTYTVSDSTIVFSQAEQYMLQSIENIDSLIGREATATVYYDDGTADKGTATISDTAYFFTTSRTHCLVYTQNGIKGLEIWAAAPCNIVGVKLELGNTATPFVPPDPATELAKCQRYYYSTYQGVPAGTPASYANELVLNATSTNRFNHTMIDFPTTMRTTPTVKFFDPVTGEEGYAHKTETDEKVPVTIIIAGQDRVNFGSSELAVGTDYYLHYTASAEL